RAQLEGRRGRQRRRPLNYSFSPRARSSAITAGRPSLSIRRMPRAETRSVIQRRSSSSQNRLSLRLISKRRLVWRFEWLTFEPTSGFFPVTWHSRDMTASDLRLFELDVLANHRVVLLQH